MPRWFIDKIYLNEVELGGSENNQHQLNVPKPKLSIYRLVPLPEDLATQFHTEAIDAITGFENYADAYDALWRGHFEALRAYIQPGDFNLVGELPRPRPLRAFVGPHALCGFFRAWLRKQEMDPDIVLQVRPAYADELRKETG